MTAEIRIRHIRENEDGAIHALRAEHLQLRFAKPACSSGHSGTGGRLTYTSSSIAAGWGAVAHRDDKAMPDLILPLLPSQNIELYSNYGGARIGKLDVWIGKSW